MQLVKRLLNTFNGLHFTQEYLCFGKETFTNTVNVYLANDKTIISNITGSHLFVGYCPLVFALPSFPNLQPAETIAVIFSHQLLQPNEVFLQKDAIAAINLKLIKEQATENAAVLYYEGTHGWHRFLSKFHQKVNDIHNNWYNKKPGNVFLHNNLYKQVQIAYAVPRNIGLIIVGGNSELNLFPTDLHGQIDEQHYIISLRSGGKANEQVVNSGQIVISQMAADAYKMVYTLGKNHMQPLKPKAAFPFSNMLSATFKLPIPQQTIASKELQLLTSFSAGIHHIMLFKIVAQHQIQKEKNTLAHIHNTYATWRYKNKLTGNYLLR